MNSNAAPMNFKDRTGRFIKLFALIVAVIFCANAQQSARPPAAYPPLPDWIGIQRDIHYDRYPATILDVLQPKKRAVTKAPAVVVFHGGGWIHSGKETAYTSLCLPYLQRGFVVFNVEYRVASQATAPAAVTDALDATHWVFQHARQYNIDPKKIVITGGSAGGHLALMVGMTPKSAHMMAATGSMVTASPTRSNCSTDPIIRNGQMNGFRPAPNVLSWLAAFRP